MEGLGVCGFCFLFILCFAGDKCIVLCDDLSEERISAIEKTLREQAEKLEEQTLEISQLKKTVIIQTEEIADLKKTVFYLKRKHFGQKQELSLLKSLIQRSTKLEDIANNRSNDVSEQAELMPVEGAINRGSRMLNPLPTSAPGPSPSRVAFHAYLSKTEPSPSPHHMIVFDSTTINLQNSYNVHSGMFTAPVPGIYAFFFSMRLGQTAYHSFELVKKSDVQEVIFSESNNYVGDTFSGSGIIRLQTGDVVFSENTWKVWWTWRYIG